MDRLIAIRDARQHTEPVAELESTEHVEGHLNTPEATIAHESDEATNGEQPQPPLSPQIEAPVMVVASNPVEQEPITPIDDGTNAFKPITQEEVTLGTTTSPSQGHGPQPSDDATENITPESGQNVRVEPSILDILEAE